jgi:hypothetical protein
MISIELVRAVQAERERQMVARHRGRNTENGGRRGRINRRGQDR